MAGLAGLFPEAQLRAGSVGILAERGDQHSSTREAQAVLWWWQLTRVRAIAERHREAASRGATELHRIARWLADQWTSENIQVLASP